MAAFTTDVRPFFRECGFAGGGDGREVVQGVVEHAVFFAAADDVPCFFGGEAEDGRHQEHEAAGDVVERGLRAAAGVAVFFGGVETVFQNIQIKRAKVFGAELYDVLHGKVEGVARVVAT